MYGMVLMAAVTGSADVTAIGHRDGGGCTGVVAGCNGFGGGCNGKHGGGGLFHRDRGGCDGGSKHHRDRGGCSGRGHHGDRGGCNGKSGGLFHRDRGGCNGHGRRQRSSAAAARAPSLPSRCRSWFPSRSRNRFPSRSRCRLRSSWPRRSSSGGCTGIVAPCALLRARSGPQARPPSRESRLLRLIATPIACRATGAARLPFFVSGAIV